jgi:hypothetical protein
VNTTLVPPGFLFSQHSLGTYLRCPRRFLLRYVDRQPWPMPEDAEPRLYQEHLARGREFHQWLVREHLGLPMAPIVASCGDARLQRWWKSAQRFARDELPSGLREAELPLVVPLGAYRLYARFDYLALDPGGEAVVVDWKTLERLPAPRVLHERIQTRVYLYTLVAAGHVFTGGAPIDPSQVYMLYWFAEFPEELATIRYSWQAFERDRTELHRLVAEIASRPREGFTVTDDVHLCARCIYRSLCHVDEVTPAGETADWLDEDIDFSLELADIADLEY